MSDKIFKTEHKFTPAGSSVAPATTTVTITAAAPSAAAFAVQSAPTIARTELASTKPGGSRLAQLGPELAAWQKRVDALADSLKKTLTVTPVD